MTIGTDLRTKLLADETLASLVGTRVYPVILPKNTHVYPAITHCRNAMSVEYVWFAVPDMNNTLLEINIYSPGYTEACEIEQAVVQALDGFRGVTDSATVISTTRAGTKEGYVDFDGGGLGLFLVTVVFVISYQGG